MLDIKFIRQNPDKVKEGCQKKGYPVNLDLILKLDKEKRSFLVHLEEIRAAKNKASREIPQLTEQKKKEIFAKMKLLDKKEEKLKKLLRAKENQLNELLLKIPNLPLETVPYGKDESNNTVLREVGKKPTFNFQPKSYLQLGKKFDLIDVERASKVAGSRFGYLKRELVLIEFALIKMATDFLIEKGFIPLLPPVMLKPEMARGTGYFEANDLKEAYFLPQDNLFLIGTSEQAILTMHAGEILEEKDLPKKYFSFSTCFRREAGSWGKDVAGIFRVHQFDKLEMFSFCKPEESQKEHNFFLEIEETLMQKLEIPYRVVQICTGDLGFPAASKYDIESWFPAENKYRETHSTSNCTDFQARRLNIRYKNRGRKFNFVHTVNGTVFSQRPILSLIENYQTKEGSILMPVVLQKYLPFKEIPALWKKR